MRLDARSTFPKGMEEYLQYYGWKNGQRLRCTKKLMANVLI